MGDNTRGGKILLMIPASQLMPEDMPDDKRPQWGLADSVSDNCSVGRLVWNSGLRKLRVMKKCQIRGGFIMNVIFWQRWDNRPFAVDVKWLCRLAWANNCA